MSTRSTLVFIENDEVSFHLYHEMHDGCDHLEIQQKMKLDDGRIVENNSVINVVIPDDMAEGLTELLDRQRNG